MVVKLVTDIDLATICLFSPVTLALLICLIQISSFSSTIPPLKHPFLLKVNDISENSLFYFYYHRTPIAVSLFLLFCKAMPKENPLTDIFSEYDPSIISDGSIDPMGLRIIWTGLGGKIFNNKLNTISTDIRLYTLNLFHHYLLQKNLNRKETTVIQLLNQSNYHNRSDLNEGLIILLENLMIHAVHLIDPSRSLPGMNKLNNLKITQPRHRSVTDLVADRSEGILVRQYSLGIHGRHKGPFVEMGILDRKGDSIYSLQEVWDEAHLLFQTQPWKDADKLLSSLIADKLLSLPISKGKIIQYKTADILTQELAKKYAALLQENIYTTNAIKAFWLNRLGLQSGAAKILYATFLEQMEEEPQYIFTKAYNDSQEPDLKAILVVEPFLTLIEKCMQRILNRTTTHVDAELKSFINDWLENHSIETSEINTFLSTNTLNDQANNRLKDLLAIYTNCRKSPDQAEQFVVQLIKYHHRLMDSRGNLKWVSVGVNNRISVHKSLYSSEKYLKSRDWVNSYYLNTVKFLHKGLSNEAA